MGTKKTNLRSSGRRTAILEAALECFCDKGFDSTSIDDICDSSGASIGSIYHHFGSKDGIASWLYLDALSNYYEELDRVLARKTNAEGLIRKVIRHHVNWSVKNPELTRYLLRNRRLPAIAPIEEKIQSLIKTKLRELLDFLHAAVESSEVRNYPNSAYIAIIFGPCHEVVRLWSFNELRGNVEEIRDALCDAAWLSLRLD
jgi:AcrR family transcriptional regulator